MKSGCRVRLCVRPAGTKGPGNRSVCKATCAKDPPGAQHLEGALSIQTRVAGSCVYPTPVLSWEDWKVPSSGLGTLYAFSQISKLDAMQGSQGDPSTTDEGTRIGNCSGTRQGHQQQGSKQEFELVYLDQQPNVLYLTPSTSAKATSGNTHLTSLKIREHRAPVAPVF